MTVNTKFGRVDEENNVFVLELGSERKVGQYPGVSPEEALAFYERKFADLEGQVRILEQRVKNKVDAGNLGKQATRLADELKEPNAVGDLNDLRKRIENLSPAIEVLSAAKSEANKEAVAKALADRTELAVAAEQIANQDASKIQWKASSQKMTDLFDAWQAAQKNGPKVSKSDADPIWKRFSLARTRFETAKRQYFANLDSNNKAVKAKKLELVESVEKLAAAGSDSMVDYRKLLDAWKAAGRTPGKSDDALWARFKAAGDTIFEARKSTAAVENTEQSANLELKLALLKQYASIDPATGLEEAKKSLLELQKKWEKIGRVPKDKLRDTEDKLRSIESKVKSAEQDHWRKTDPASIDRSNSVISQLEDSIAKLEAELKAATTSGNAKKISDAKEALSARQAWLEAVKAAAK